MSEHKIYISDYFSHYYFYEKKNNSKKNNLFQINKNSTDDYEQNALFNKYVK